MSSTRLMVAAAAIALLGAPLTAAARAPSSRRVAATPDLTGVWASPFRVAAQGFPLGAGQTSWMPVSEGDPLKVKLPTIDELVAQAEKMGPGGEARGGPPGGGPGGPGGGGPGGPGGPPPGGPPGGSVTSLPLTAAGRAAAAKLDPKKLEQQRVDCYPANIFLRLPGSPVQIVQDAKAISFLTEATPAGRTIFMDGRSNADAVPQWNGHSVGHWDGGTLKIDTVALRGGLFGFDHPMSDNATVHEEYHLRPDHKQLIGVITFSDPEYYTEPMRKAVYLDWRPDLEVLDYQCEEGKDDMIETLTDKKG